MASSLHPHSPCQHSRGDSDRLLEALATTSHLLLTEDNYSQAIDRALSILGEAVNVDRIYIFENHTDPATAAPVASQRWEWVAPGIVPEIDNPALQNLSYQDLFPRWYRVLSQGDSIEGLVEAFPASERMVLEAQQIRSILVMPIRANHEFWGFVGFDACRQEHIWSEGEKALLKAAIGSLGGRIRQQQTQESLQKLNERLEVKVAERTQDLRHSRDRLFNLADNLPGVLCELRLNSAGQLVFSYVSSGIQSLLGIGPVTLLTDATVLNRFFGTDQPTLEQTLQQAAAVNQNWEHEWCIADAEGKQKWIRGVARPEKQPNGDILWYAYLSDISDRKQFEAKLQLWQQAVKASSNAIVISDARQPEMPIIYANPAFVQQTGYSEAATLGRNCRFLQGEDSNQPGLQQLRLAIQAATSCTVLLRNYRQDGTLFWNELTISPIFDDKGTLTHFVGIQNDITEHKLTEEALKRQQLQLSSLLDNIPHIAWLKDAESRFIAVNKPFSLACNRSSTAELVNQTDLDVWPLKLAQQYRQDDQAVMQSRQQKRVEEKLETADGSIRWIETIKTPIFDDEAAVIGTVGIAMDVTERKQAEDTLRQSEAQFRQQAQVLQNTLVKLQQAQSQMIQSEKMSSLGQLVAGVAHEINNPVSFIYGNIDYAKQYVQDLLELVTLYRAQPPNAENRRFQQKADAIELDFLIQDLPQLLDSIAVGAERIRQIVLSLRTFSRMDEADKKEVDIHAGIDSTLMLLAHRLKAQADRSEIAVICDYGNLPAIECYAGQLNQVFMNILANAIDALEEANESNGLPYCQQKAGQIRIRTEQTAANRVTIRITDNGPGVPQSICSDLFNPFFTTKPIGKGTGMGLALCYQIIVERHGGQLTLNPETQQGAEFVIEIPIRQTAASS
ncbi:PAS domain S-box protein [Sphaerothrix gracilis]|uniref:PAS domain S-box protein n=1 Tax=Sphaerothrix gracilis TaxID=3151835 RepID=UPI0031FD0B6B